MFTKEWLEGLFLTSDSRNQNDRATAFSSVDSIEEKRALKVLEPVVKCFSSELVHFPQEFIGQN